VESDLYIYINLDPSFLTISSRHSGRASTSRKSDPISSAPDNEASGTHGNGDGEVRLATT